MVDDDLACAKLIGTRLSIELAYRVLICSAAEQLVPMAIGTRADLVLLDLVVNGAAELVSKPFDIDNLLASVTKASMAHARLRRQASQSAAGWLSARSRGTCASYGWSWRCSSPSRPSPLSRSWPDAAWRCRIDWSMLQDNNDPTA